MQNSSITSPGQLVTDTTNKEIYDFMQELIAHQQLRLSNGLEIEPQPNCDLSEVDSEFLKNFLIDSNNATTADSSGLKTGTFSVTVDRFDRCLTKADISFMLEQKATHLQFRWDNSRLGFDRENKKNWYIFSIPLFSQDKTEVIIMIRDLCQGLCGSGQTILFKKESKGWVPTTINSWYH